MKILFFSHFFYPHIGGVEKHVLLLSKELIKNGDSVTVITERFDNKLKKREKIDGINVIRIDYPKRKFIGLIYIWYSIWQNRKLILEHDIIHIHDVFIWYLPFRFFYFWKKVFISIHGYEPVKPFLYWSVMQKRIAIKLTNGSIGVGKFIEKYAGVKFTKLIYGAVDIQKISKFLKRKNTIVFVGRLSNDTGILKFLEYLDNHKDLKASFAGDGEFRSECEKYGKVHGFINPEKFLANAEYAVPGGYLACLESFAAKCKVKVFWSDQLKKDYWEMSPMYKFIKSEDIDGAYEWSKKQTWLNITFVYKKLWNNV